MTYTITALIYRKPGLTPAEFRTHYDTVHVPLLKSLVGESFPITHTRNYVMRTHADAPSDGSAPKRSPTPSAQNSASDDWLPTLYKGQPSDFPFDSVTVMVWENKAVFDRFCEIFYQEEVQKAMREDEEKFKDTRFEMVCALEEPVFTARE